MYISGLMVSYSKFQFSDRDHFLGGKSMDLLSNSDIMILLLKTNGERDRRPNFVIFLIWRALMLVAGWWWLRAEILVYNRLKYHLLWSWFNTSLGEAG